MATAPPRNWPYSAFEHDATVAQLQARVVSARDGRGQLRARGALHSEAGSILGERAATGQGWTQHLMLERFDHVHIDAHTGRAVVGAGVSLGGDPNAPGEGNPQADPARSLVERLDAAGWALPITGGITHQTISGFLATGSAGGSVAYSFQDAVQRIQLVDGEGRLVDILRGDPDFDAVLVSLGLLGVITEVELQCEPRFDIVGLRSVQAEEDCDVELFREVSPDGRATLRQFLETKPYSRLMWWPQPGVGALELWEAARHSPTLHGRLLAAGAVPGQAEGVTRPVPQYLARWVLAVAMEALAPTAGEGVGRFPRRVRERVQRALGLPYRLLERAGDAVLDSFLGTSRTQLAEEDLAALREDVRRLVVHTWQRLRGTLPEPPRRYHPAPGLGVPGHAPRTTVGRTAVERMVAWLIEQFLSLSPRADTPWVDADGFTRRYCAEVFRDPWHRGLPMDNPIHDRLLPVTFTEAWVPIEHTAEAMRRLRSLFRRGRLAATGTFCIELYAAKASSAWLSAAHGTDVFRIDPFWFDDGDLEARQRFFTQFWDALADLDVRLHWAKALSGPETTTGVAHRQRVLPRLEEFRTVRRRYDPHDVFLTRYWQEHLGL